MVIFKDFVERLKSFSPDERRVVFFYICGIMLYKFGLEAFDGSITALATNRYDFETAIFILYAATGGTSVPEAYRKEHPKDEWSEYGDYNNDAIIPIYTVTGITYGMKLRQMDSLVHIFYEVAGTSGGFVTALVLVPSFGNNCSFIITPICFSLVATLWFCVSNYLINIGKGFLLSFESIWVGARILFTSTRFVWLVPAYGVTLYGHQYLENGIAPQVSRRYLGNSAWLQTMVGGSNFVGQAWIVAATFLPICFGWAAGDVSRHAAYIQASLARLEDEEHRVSPLGAVMAFLYSFYVATYAIAGTVLGRYLDGVYNRKGSVREALVNTTGVHLTIIMITAFASTFIPEGSCSFNRDPAAFSNMSEKNVLQRTNFRKGIV
ncbi:hypothetical protein CORC01_00973 [Colletotrichum orchidophilum]|uniref:Uncharacterized protein n=1 Tax=Colletotrichum orchidophilum TaxID=1209926 RepID=A0A1G4BQD3_9PEZI|nr:uncharacterized protein CORC01_00973 [Colletotrichum orchidophilum]OHF03654.1 hypothetical protein CORC01_00973 [Colletotrichum orchidophilum]